MGHSAVFCAQGLATALCLCLPAFSHGAEKTATLEQIPDLDVSDQTIELEKLENPLLTMAPTNHMSILESHSIPWITSGALNARHNITGVFLAWIH